MVFLHIQLREVCLIPTSISCGSQGLAPLASSASSNLLYRVNPCHLSICCFWKQIRYVWHYACLSWFQKFVCDLTSWENPWKLLKSLQFVALCYYKDEIDIFRPLSCQGWKLRVFFAFLFLLSLFGVYSQLNLWLTSFLSKFPYRLRTSLSAPRILH